MYDGIIFDMDGTIWDSRETIVKAWNDELKAQGIDRVITVSELTGYMGLTMDAIAEGIFPDKKYSETKHIFDKMYERENEYLRKKGAILYPDVISTIKELKKKGYNIDKKLIDRENLNTLGTHIVTINLHKKVVAHLNVVLKAGGK